MSHLSPQRRALEPVLRRAFHLFWRFSRGMTLGVRALVVDGDGRVLLVKHTYVDGWHLPGGGVEPGETLYDALVRELREEANVELVEQPDLHGMFFNRRISRRDHVAVFVVRRFRHHGAVPSNREIVEAAFFGPDQLPADTSPGTRARLDEVLRGASVRPDW